MADLVYLPVEEKKKAYRLVNLVKHIKIDMFLQWSEYDDAITAIKLLVGSTSVTDGQRILCERFLASFKHSLNVAGEPGTEGPVLGEGSHSALEAFNALKVAWDMWFPLLEEM